MLRITKKQHLLYKTIIYVVTILIISITGYVDYLRWLNPLNLKVEENPKQHDGSQEFTPPQEFKSSVQPLSEDGSATIYVSPEQLKKYGEEVETESDEETDQKELPIIPQIGIDN